MGDATMEIEHDRLTDSLSEYWSRAGLSSQDIAKDLLGRRDDKTARRILLALLDLKKLDKDEQKISDEIALRIIQCDIKARLRKEDGNSESKRVSACKSEPATGKFTYLSVLVSANSCVKAASAPI